MSTYHYGVFRRDRHMTGVIESHGKQYVASPLDFDQNINPAQAIDRNMGLAALGDFDYDGAFKGLDGMPVMFFPNKEKNSLHIHCLGARDAFRPLEKYPLPVEALNALVSDETVLKVNLIILLEGRGSPHIDTGNYYLEKMQFYAKPETPASAVLKACVEKLRSGRSAASREYAFYKDITETWGDCVVSKPYESIGSTDFFTKQGSALRSLGLPWSVIGQNALANPAPALKVTATLADNGVTSARFIYCKAYLPGNKLTAYPGGGWRQYSG